VADTFSRAKRSEVMSRIRGMNTQPELAVRRTLHRLGHRFRLHVMSLPGRPDILLPKHRTVIQVKGCFWHAHFCLGGRIPPGKYWRAKFARNQLRDRRNERRLRRLGWRVVTVWECRVRRWTPSTLEAQLIKQLAAQGAARARSAKRAARPRGASAASPRAS
jgi:DNA mismatch endonuclease (patch repair protein)